MLDLSKNNKLPFYIVSTVLLVILLVFVVVKIALSVDLLNDTEVEPDSTLTYYLNVSYDGVDRLGVESSDLITSEVRSGYIFVEDKIPEGLIFTGFVATEDGTIGAVSRADDSACIGNVVDDTNEVSVEEGTWNAGNTEFTYHGLHYYKDENKVAFKVRNLKAGCVLTVGIITQTPEIDDPETVEVETRRDFYNIANARENSLSINSNLLHAYMGSATATLYDVSYQYTGTVPNGATALLPSTVSYEENAQVNVANNILLEGYEFSGWSASGLTITNGVFAMPGNDVILTGSFTEIEKNSVSYVIDSEYPDNYEVPSTKEYYPDTSVELDSMKSGDVYNGYRFSGWDSDDVTLDNEENFIMPNNDVVLRGGFRAVEYTITYAFYDTVLPPNSSSLLPESEEYAPGEVVTLPTIANQPGYQFLGWYHEDNFEMGSEDITIYGEWRTVSGEFDVEIEKEIIDEQDYYEAGDAVNFKITVTNPNNFGLTDVVVKELNDDTIYTTGNGYTITSDHFVTISSMAANTNVEINAYYTMKSTDTFVENTAKIIGALAVNGYVLEEDDYESTVSFGTKPIIRVCNNMSPNLGNKIKYKINNTAYTYETWLNLANGECQDVMVDVGTYKVKELIPQEYNINSVTGAVNADNASFTISKGQTKQITYNNSFVNEGFLHSSGSVDNKIEYNPLSIVSKRFGNQISAGDEVAIDTEHFYVVSSNQNETVLLAKYNLLVGDIYYYDIDGSPNFSLIKTLSSSDSGYGLQNSTAIGCFFPDDADQFIGTVPFSGTNYWDSSVCEFSGSTFGCTGTSNLLSEYSGNGETYNVSPYPYVYRSSIGNTVAPSVDYTLGEGFAQNNGYTISYYVEQYVNTLKTLGAPSTISGRLLSYEEARAITQNFQSTSSYWLGSVYNKSEAWYYDYGGMSFFRINMGDNSSAGVRPAIEIPTEILETLPYEDPV